MALTPLDIQNKTFPTKMRGYNQDEVDDFLDLVVRDYEELVSKNRDMEKTLRHAEEKLEYFNELKDALNQSIIVAQDTADKVKTSANKESEVIVANAQNRSNELVADAEARVNYLVTTAEERARQIIDEAVEKARELVVETDDLKKSTRVFHQRLILMLESQLETVKTEDWNEILKPVSSYVKDSHVTIKELFGDEFGTTGSVTQAHETVYNESTPEVVEPVTTVEEIVEELPDATEETETTKAEKK